MASRRLLEVNDRNAARLGTSQQDAAGLLAAHGYRFEVSDGDRLVPLRGAAGVGNVVARPVAESGATPF